MSGHSVDFVVTERGADDMATEWRSRCGCGLVWRGPTYEAAEDDWRRHVHAETGRAPNPFGVTRDRWTP